MKRRFRFPFEAKKEYVLEVLSGRILKGTCKLQPTTSGAKASKQKRKRSWTRYYEHQE